MFTPQKIGSAFGGPSFHSANFQNTLRKYQPSSAKELTLSRTSLKSSRYVGNDVMSQEDRMKRFIRVREEEMARSRSKVKRIQDNKREWERSRIKPIIQFQRPSVEFNSVIDRECFEELKMIQLEYVIAEKNEECSKEGKGNEEMITDEDEQTQRTEMEIETEINFDQYQQMQTEQTQATPHAFDSSSCPFNQPTHPSYQNYTIIQPTPLPFQFSYPTSCPQPLLVQQFSPTHCPTPCQISNFTSNDNQIQFHCISQTSGGCILIKNKLAYYRISLRQLKKVWKQINNLDSLVHYICNNRPHLVPVKEQIAIVIGNYLL